ncbi:MAG: hypothetical protein ACE5SV_06960 [Candidatus Nitrosomaritimum aestuariumsis]
MMSQFEPEEIAIEREGVIIDEIQKNPDLHHNALIKKIVPRYMAKTTFERVRDNLIEKNVISCLMKGNKKFYRITENYEKRSLQLIERMTHLNFQHLQHETKRLRDDYHHKDVNEKISKGIQLLRELLQIDNGFTILDSIKNSKKTLYKNEHLEIQEMIAFVFLAITNDKNAEMIFPQIMSSVGFNFTKNFAESK